MLSYIAAVVLLLIAAQAVVLRKTYYFVPAKELKRHAEAGDPLAKTLYRAVAYGSSLRALLWVVIVAASAGGFALFAQVAPAWMGFALVAIVLWLAFSWLPNTRTTSLGARWTTLVTPVVAWFLAWLHPLLGRSNRLATRRYTGNHTGVFEREDLFALLDRQAGQSDSRITPEELGLVKHVLSFGDYKVRDSLRSRKDIRSVAVSDPIGPVLLDELHASGQTSFPVKKAPRSEEIIGSLQLSDVDIHSTGTVKDYMTEGVTYVHENDSLADTLHIFHQTKNQLFVVINNFEEYVGIITLEDVLHRLTGPIPDPEIVGPHDDMATAKARHTPKETVVDEEIDMSAEGLELATEPVEADVEPEADPEDETPPESENSTETEE